MKRSSISKQLWVALTLSCGLVGAVQAADLAVSVDRQTITNGLGLGALHVQVINRIDNIAGFELFLQCSRPDVIEFVRVQDSLVSIDPAGTLTGNWQYLIALTQSGELSEVNIVGLADLPGLPTVAPIQPDTSLRTVISVPFRILPGADTITGGVEILISPSLNRFGFARSDGSLIGVSGGVLDTTIVQITSGSVTVAPCCVGVRGNVNCSPDEQVDIADLLQLLDWLFSGFPLYCCLEEANADGSLSESPDIADLTFLVDHLFVNNPPLPSCP